MDPTPSPIQRFSSRRGRLDRSFLTARLVGARAYDRIAGYFSSSILEVAGEAPGDGRGQVRMVCNSASTRGRRDRQGRPGGAADGVVATAGIA